MKRAQQGAAALVVVLLLAFIVLLAAAFANRNLIVEQRASADQYRSTQALEAAEAGAEWMLAELNSGRVDSQCAPSAASSDGSVRERYLAIDATSGNIILATAKPALPACVKNAAAWSCACPASGAPVLPAAIDDGLPHPAFVVDIDQSKAPRAGLLHMTLTGCTAAAGPCASGAAPADASATLDVDLALLPALRSVPTATLTARGNVISDATFGVRNADANDSGITIDAGGAIAIANAHVVSTPGTPRAASLIANDSTLSAATLSAARLFAGVFGMDKASYRRLPTVKTLNCANGDCTAAAHSAIAAGQRALWIDGDANLGAAMLGSPTDPVILIATGHLHVDGALRLHGLVYAAALSWNNAAAGQALLRGTAVVEGSIDGNGAPDYVYDRALLQRLQLTRGSFVKLPGSWKDFH
jgi:hypothetical protein